MKNKYFLFLITALAVTAFSSCKKNIQTCKLGKYFLSDGSSTPNPATFTYYESGQLKTIEYSNGSKDTLAYDANNITIFSYDKGGILIASFNGLLNGNGAVTSGTKNTYSFNGNITGTDNLSYEYNAEGRMTKQTTVNGSGTTFLSLVYNGGNTATGGYYAGGFLTKKYFFYHNKSENKTKIDDLSLAYTPWLGNPSANLLDSLRIITPATDDTIRIQYNHRLDDNAYVSGTVQTWLKPNTQTRYHTYQYFDCN